MDPNQQPVAPSPQPTRNPVQPPVAASNPGKALGIASLLIALLTPLGVVSLVLGIIGKSKSKKVGQPNGVAVAGIIFSVLNMLAGLAIIFLMVFAVSYTSTKIKEECDKAGTGAVYIEDADAFYS